MNLYIINRVPSNEESITGKIMSLEYVVSPWLLITSYLLT